MNHIIKNVNRVSVSDPDFYVFLKTLEEDYYGLQLFVSKNSNRLNKKGQKVLNAILDSAEITTDAIERMTRK